MSAARLSRFSREDPDVRLLAALVALAAHKQALLAASDAWDGPQEHDPDELLRSTLRQCLAYSNTNLPAGQTERVLDVAGDILARID